MSAAEQQRQPDPNQPSDAAAEEPSVSSASAKGEEELPSDPAELREEIAHTREDLGQTVEALAAKTDIKQRAKEKLAESKEQLEAKANTAKTRLTEASGNLRGAVPEPAQRAVGEVKNQARQRSWVPVLTAAMFLMLILRRVKRRGR